MTTKARKWARNPGLLQTGVWNVRGLYGKEKLLQEELIKANVDIAVIPETKQKKKTKGFARNGRLYFTT